MPIEGAVVAFTTRFFKVILSMEDQFVSWPSPEEKVVIKTINQSYLGFPDCLGFIDGTHICLEDAPVWRENEFYNRKGSHSIQTMAICDHKRRIRYVETGYFGSSHDMRVLAESDMGKNPSKYCVGNEYVLGDGGYSPTNYLVPVSKKPRNGTTADDDQQFNTYISQMRIKIEHAFGILKARFQSLKQLRLKIKSKDDVVYASGWIRVCIALNNFLIDRESDSFTAILEKQFAEKERLELQQLEDGVQSSSDETSNNTDVTESGKEKYQAIKNIVLEEMKQRKEMRRRSS